MPGTLAELQQLTRQRGRTLAKLADLDARRVDLIHKAAAEGERGIDIAAAADLSKQRVHQILRGD